MALGSTYNPNNRGYGNNGGYNNGNNNQNNSDTYYSRFNIRNYNDNLSLQVTYWRGTMKLAITTFDNTINKSTDVISIFFSPTKAQIFAKCVENVIKNEVPDKIYGIDTGSGDPRGFIAISRDISNGGTPYIIIAKINSNGAFTASQRFNFNNDYNYYLELTDLDNMKYQKVFDNICELEKLKDLLYDYSRSMNGAYAYSTVDIARYETNRMMNMISGNGGRSNNYSNNNKPGFFSNNNGSTNNTSSSSSSDNNNGGNNAKKSYTSITSLEDELE